MAVTAQLAGPTGAQLSNESMAGLQGALQTFGKMKQDAYKEAWQRVLDMAKTQGIDLATLASTPEGKAAIDAQFTGWGLKPPQVGEQLSGLDMSAENWQRAVDEKAMSGQTQDGSVPSQPSQPAPLSVGLGKPQLPDGEPMPTKPTMQVAAAPQPTAAPPPPGPVKVDNVDVLARAYLPKLQTMNPNATLEEARAKVLSWPESVKKAGLVQVDQILAQIQGMADPITFLDRGFLSDPASYQWNVAGLGGSMDLNAALKEAIQANPELGKKPVAASATTAPAQQAAAPAQAPTQKAMTPAEDAQDRALFRKYLIDNWDTLMAQGLLARDAVKPSPTGTMDLRESSANIYNGVYKNGTLGTPVSTGGASPASDSQTSPQGTKAVVDGMAAGTAAVRRITAGAGVVPGPNASGDMSDPYNRKLLAAANFLDRGRRMGTGEASEADTGSYSDSVAQLYGNLPTIQRRQALANLQKTITAGKLDEAQARMLDAQIGALTEKAAADQPDFAAALADLEKRPLMANYDKDFAAADDGKRSPEQVAERRKAILDQYKLIPEFRAVYDYYNTILAASVGGKVELQEAIIRNPAWRWWKAAVPKTVVVQSVGVQSGAFPSSGAGSTSAPSSEGAKYAASKTGG